ncbi:hypothetical protein, partial [Caulobacter sp. 17J65-9]|uniref:hypothetical protein n=1 Tax=Caulobacter sp. 17J65-9 TaxID=2709382 RepID=UPI0013C7E04D
MRLLVVCVVALAGALGLWAAGQFGWRSPFPVAWDAVAYGAMGAVLASGLGFIARRPDRKAPGAPLEALLADVAARAAAFRAGAHARPHSPQRDYPQA